MKTIKTILVLLLLTSFSQMNAQKILEKWVDLDNVNQIFTKVSYVAIEGKIEILGQYTSVLKDYTDKIDEKAIPADLGTPAVIGMIKNLKTLATELNNVSNKKASKDEILNTVKSFGETLNNLIASCKIE